MTLTISQLQHMYGTKVYELKGRDVTPAPVVQRAANAAQEIIPAEDNPLFMSVEQRADAARTVQNVSQTPEEVKLATQNAVQDAKDREDPVIPEFDWKPE